MKVGVLALQGSFREHLESFDALGVHAERVRRPEELARVDAIVLPGGESTTIAKLLVANELAEPLRARIAEGLPAFGTCAGLILLAGPLGALDATVVRNAYGSQAFSFEADLAIAGLDGAFRGVFIRAPVVAAAGPAVSVLAEHRRRPVLVRAGSVWASTFHPELAHDLRVHQKFVEEVAA